MPTVFRDVRFQGQERKTFTRVELFSFCTTDEARQPLRHHFLLLNAQRGLPLQVARHLSRRGELKPRPSARGIKSLLMPRNWSWLHSALHTRVDCIERCRAADVKSISLLTAEAQVGDRFRNVDLAEQITLWSVAAHAVLVLIAPTYGAPNAPGGVAARPVSNAGLGHFCKDFAVRHLSGPHIQVEHADMRRVVRPFRAAVVDALKLLLVWRQGNTVRVH